MIEARITDNRVVEASYDVEDGDCSSYPYGKDISRELAAIEAVVGTVQAMTREAKLRGSSISYPTQEDGGETTRFTMFEVPLLRRIDYRSAQHSPYPGDGYTTRVTISAVVCIEPIDADKLARMAMYGICYGAGRKRASELLRCWSQVAGESRRILKDVLFATSYDGGGDRTAIECEAALTSPDRFYTEHIAREPYIAPSSRKAALQPCYLADDESTTVTESTPTIDEPSQIRKTYGIPAASCCKPVGAATRWG